MSDDFFNLAAGAAVGYLRAACGDRFDASDEAGRTRVRDAIRQALVDTDTMRKLGERGREPVDREVQNTVHIAFLREACCELSYRSRRLLDLAGRQVDMVGVISIVESLPLYPQHLLKETWRQGFCSRMLEQAHERCQPDDGSFKAVFDYFTLYIPTRPADVIETLSAAFVGVLISMGGIAFSIEPRAGVHPKAIAHPTERRWKFTWFRKGVGK